MCCLSKCSIFLFWYKWLKYQIDQTFQQKNLKKNNIEKNQDATKIKLKLDGRNFCKVVHFAKLTKHKKSVWQSVFIRQKKWWKSREHKNKKKVLSPKFFVSKIKIEVVILDQSFEIFGKQLFWIKNSQNKQKNTVFMGKHRGFPLKKRKVFTCQLLSILHPFVQHYEQLLVSWITIPVLFLQKKKNCFKAYCVCVFEDSINLLCYDI